MSTGGGSPEMGAPNNDEPMVHTAITLCLPTVCTELEIEQQRQLGKRQKTYVEAVASLPTAVANTLPEVPVHADYPILSTVITPNGTRGSFAGKQSITPGGEHACFWMKPDNMAIRKEIKQLTFLP